MILNQIDNIRDLFGHKVRHNLPVSSRCSLVTLIPKAVVLSETYIIVTNKWQ